MSGKYGLIKIPSNQSLINEYENEIQTYLDVKEDNFWHDDFYPAWKDNRIGGMREALKKRLEITQKITKSNFAAFKQARSEELQRLINEAGDSQQRSELEKEYRLLQESDSYVSFGKKTGVFDEYVRNINISNASDNKQQVNWTVAYLDKIIEQRFEMAQSMAFSVANNDDVSLGEKHFRRLYDKILQGAQNYNAHKDDGLYATNTGRLEYQDGLAFQEMRQYAHEAKGIAQAYDDAIRALYDSPMFKQMRQYHLQKAKDKNDLSAWGAWESGDRQALFAYISQKGIMENSGIRNERYRALFEQGVGRSKSQEEMADFDDADRARSVYADKNNLMIKSSLMDLEEKEALYHFLMQKVNEFNQECKQNPSLNEKNVPSSYHYALDLPDHQKTIDQARNTVTGLADLMIQKGSVAKSVVSYGEMAATFAAGAAVAAGTVTGFVPTLVVAGGVAMGLGFAEGYALDKSEWLRETRADVVDYCARMLETPEKYFSSLKNSHIIKQAKQIVGYQKVLVEQAQKRLNALNEKDFESALAYGLKKSAGNKELLQFVQEAHDLSQLSPEELAKKEQYLKEDFARFNLDEKKKNNIIAQKDLTRRALLLEAVKTGNYFYYGKLFDQIEKENGFYTLYHGEEANVLKAVSAAMTYRVGREIEADCRQSLIDEWQKVKSNPNHEEEANDLSAEVDEYEDEYDYGWGVSFTDTEEGNTASLNEQQPSFANAETTVRSTLAQHAQQYSERARVPENPSKENV